jgi:hypothetical protein
MVMIQLRPIECREDVLIVFNGYAADLYVG